MLLRGVRAVSEVTPTGRPEGFWPSFFRFWGALLWGRYEADKKARRNAGIGFVVTSLLTIIGGVIYRSDGRTDRMLEAMREEARQTNATMLRAVIAVEQLAHETRETRTTLLEKIPDAQPAPKPVRHQPAKATR